jgi:two-component system sensor histidine kinase KdpD
MSSQRPDPDALLARVQAEEAKQARGKLKIFFGAAPGVGKTYAMLEGARKAGKEGADVVVGYIEPHCRPDTQALVLGLDVLPKLEVEYRSAKLLEFNLDAALALHPQILIVDELAHTNAPGVTHAKRWQDVMRLLDAGINVYTTLNVQHLESLNDVVAQITGVVVRETVPDSIFERADEVELVDLPPDDLLERLREGKIYIAREAERAMAHFFTKGNLIALRELALRRTAERVGEQMDVYRDEHAVRGTWPARERLLVCIGPSPFACRLVRATRRMAASLKSPWVAVHVETPNDANISDADKEQLTQTLRLAEQLGGETTTLSGQSIADELIQYARSRNATKIVVGKPKQPRWKELFHGSLVYELTRKCGDIDVYVISGDPQPGAAPIGPQRRLPTPRIGYLWALLVVLACTGLGSLLSPYLSPTNLVMIYLLGVVAVSLGLGRGPSILTTILSVAAFDFAFVPPRWTFAVRDTEYFLTFLVMLVTGLVISTLTARVQFQAESARRRERRTAALYAMSRELAATQSREQIARIAARHVMAASDVQAVVFLPDENRKLLCPALPINLSATRRPEDPVETAAFAPEQGSLATSVSIVPAAADADGFTLSVHDQAVARWVFEHGQTAGRGTSTLPGSEGIYLPLPTSRETVGVLGVIPSDAARTLDIEQLHLLEAFAGLTALALERADLEVEADQIRLDIETERLRNSLLSAVSHDLRTPLSVITGASSTLLESNLSLDPEVRRELAASIVDESERLNRLVANLLDMTRLQAGALEIRKQWQPVEEVIGASLSRLGRQLKDHPVTTHVPADLPFAPFDDLLIQQVLVNLLENAARYTPSGTPLDISARQADDSILIEVADRGPGLPPGDPNRLFEKFYRAGDSKTHTGAGLGLAICRGIVQLHGGKIHAANRTGGGAVFQFSLPLTGEPPNVNVEEGIT